MAGHKLLSFMDAYYGYNQIKMYELKMEATSFVIDWGTYYSRVTLFVLNHKGNILKVG